MAEKQEKSSHQQEIDKLKREINKKSQKIAQLEDEKAHFLLTSLYGTKKRSYH